MSSRLALSAIAFVLSGIYLAVAGLSHRFEYSAPLQDRPIPEILLLFAAAFLLYLVAGWIAARARPTRGLVWLIVAFSCVFRGLLLPSTPIQEVDIYRYLWDGAVVAAGVSPFRYAPAQIDPRYTSSNGDLERLVQLRAASDPLTTIHSRVHFAQLPTVYPPVSQAVFAVATITTPERANVRIRILVMKLWFVIFDLITLITLIALLKTVGQPPGLSLLYGWCPLLLKEFANSGHLDSLAVCLTMVAVYWLVRALARPVSPNHRHEVRTVMLASASLVLLALAIGAKLYPLVTAPIFLTLLGKRFGWSGLVAGTSLLTVCTAIVLSPLLLARQINVPKNVFSQTEQTATSEFGVPLPPQDSTEQPATDPRLGLVTFLRSWEMNDLLFMITVENLKPDQAPAGHGPWFVVVPNAIRTELMSLCASRFQLTAGETAFLVTRTLMSVVMLVLIAVWTWRTSQSSDPTEWLECLFLTIAWFWLLCPTQNPWYWTWAMPLLPFARSRVWWLLSGLVMTYYLRFWLWYEFPESALPGTTYRGPEFFDYVITWLEFGPWLGLLAGGWWWRRLRMHSDPAHGRGEARANRGMTTSQPDKPAMTNQP